MDSLADVRKGARMFIMMRLMIMQMAGTTIQNARLRGISRRENSRVRHSRGKCQE